MPTGTDTGTETTPETGKQGTLPLIWFTREEWLDAAVDAMRPAWERRTGLSIPKVRVGVGFPSGGLRSAVGGQTWTRASSPDGINEITIRVTLSDPVEVLAILGHELVHAAMDCKGGHGKRFASAMSMIGYVGSPKASEAGNVLKQELTALAEALGEYPGDAGLAVEAEKRKQGTRMIRISCNSCGFVFRTTQKWVDKAAGSLSCPDYECGGDVTVAYATEQEAA